MSKARDIASAIPAPSTVSSAELGFLDGVTSAIQTQVDAKIANTLTTTTGDIIYASSANTPARLGIGSSAQVLSVSGGVPAWTTASSGGMTKIYQGAFTAVAAASRTADFTSTYDCYRIIFNIVTATVGASTWLRFSSSGTDNTSAAYAIYGSPFNAGLSQTKLDFLRAEANSTQGNYCSIDVINPKLASNTLVSGTGVWDDSAGGAGSFYMGGFFLGTTVFDGFSFIVTSGTITGTLAVYGYNK
jgi:hypothetical protein